MKTALAAPWKWSGSGSDNDGCEADRNDAAIHAASYGSTT
jgi:hypothetical protein